MQIKNHTRKTNLSLHAQYAKSLKQRIVGLIPTKEPAALVVETHFGIHTFGMKYAIDVIILNNKQHVVALKKQLKPNSIFLWNPLYKTVLELPEGIIEKSKTAIGDSILLTTE